MSRTLTALFDRRHDAEAAKSRLEAAGIGVSSVQIHDQSSAGYSATGDYSSHQNRGFWESVKEAFLPDEDRHTYEEGVRRGGALLTAQVDEADADDAVRILDEAESIDIDQRSGEWRSSGWNYPTEALAGAGATGTAGLAAERGYAGADTTDSLGTTGSAFGTTGGTLGTTDTNEERIPIVEEELKVGKREVGRGGVRVRSYVVETPVSEQVTLRDEHVSVERHAVDLPVGATDDAFRERTVEMTETAEEAVVAKEARVREELVVRKDVGSHEERIEDSVRHTEVDVDDLGTDRTATTPSTRTDY